eukprot:2871285-Prymnesium_polylepis.1
MPMRRTTKMDTQRRTRTRTRAGDWHRCGYMEWWRPVCSSPLDQGRGPMYSSSLVLNARPPSTRQQESLCSLYTRLKRLLIFDLDIFSPTRGNGNKVGLVALCGDGRGRADMGKRGKQQKLLKQQQQHQQQQHEREPEPEDSGEDESDAADDSGEEGEPGLSSRDFLLGGIEESALETTIQTLSALSEDIVLFRSRPFKQLRAAMAPLAQALLGDAAAAPQNNKRWRGKGGKSTNLDGLDPDSRLKQMDREAINQR